MLLTADNQIDPATGTVKLKAQFANEDNALFPSQFANVRMLVDVKRGANVVPNAAVQRGTPGTFVYVVGADSSVSVRKVVLGPAQGEIVSIESGLKPGEVGGGGWRRQAARRAPRSMSPAGTPRRAKAAARARAPEAATGRRVAEAATGRRVAGRKARQVRRRAGKPPLPGRLPACPRKSAPSAGPTSTRESTAAEFGEEIKKLPEDARKQRMRELRQKRDAGGGAPGPASK